MSYVGERPWWPVHKNPQQRKKEGSKRLRAEGDKIKFIDLRFERGQVVRFRKARRQDVPMIGLKENKSKREEAKCYF